MRKRWLCKPVKLMRSVEVDNNGDPQSLLSWDRVNVKLTEAGKAAGLGALFDCPIRSIKAVVNAGEVGYIDVEFYGDPEEVAEKLPEDLKCCWMMPTGQNPNDIDAFVVRCSLWSLSLSATAPMPNGCGKPTVHKPR